MGFRMPKAMSGSMLRLIPARLGALLPPPEYPFYCRVSVWGGGMTALRRVAPLSLLLLIGLLALLVLSSSDTAQAQGPPSQQGEVSGYDGPEPTPAPEFRVPVDWPLIPSGLGPGDSFRLMFLTSTTAYGRYHQLREMWLGVV